MWSPTVSEDGKTSPYTEPDSQVTTVYSGFLQSPATGVSSQSWFLQMFLAEVLPTLMHLNFTQCSHTVSLLRISLGRVGKLLLTWLSRKMTRTSWVHKTILADCLFTGGKQGKLGGISLLCIHDLWDLNMKRATLFNPQWIKSIKSILNLKDLLALKIRAFSHVFFFLICIYFWSFFEISPIKKCVCNFLS